VITLLGRHTEASGGSEPRVTPIREPARGNAVSPTAAAHGEQIHALVQQLFFRHESGPVRHVGFTPADPSTATAFLCLEVAQALAEEGRYDVGLIDAHPNSSPLQAQLQVPCPNRVEANWPIARQLWMVSRQSWLPDAGGQRVTDENLARLRELTAEFDLSILWCAPISWITARVGQTCDGLVLVLAANTTRRLVAAQIKEQMGKAQVPLLGTVLTQRRFPVPQGLYRSL
jgi:Mrp family chromosome partitioning ATPase